MSGQGLSNMTRLGCISAMKQFLIRSHIVGEDHLLLEFYSSILAPNMNRDKYSTAVMLAASTTIKVAK